jgi:hypothetical protein
MKKIAFLILLFCQVIVAAADPVFKSDFIEFEDCSLSCQCFKSIPYDGFQISLVEKCGQTETWYPSYGGQQFDSQDLCEQAIPSDKVCRKYSTQP